MTKLLKLPFKLAIVPILVVLLAFQLVGAILIGLSSIVTKLLATLFIVGTIAELATSAPASMICQTAVLSLFFAIAPHLSVWLMDKISDLMILLLDFLLS